MSDPTVPPTTTSPSATAPAGHERVAPALGALLVAVAVTSLLDDAGLVSIAWWLPVPIAALAVALLVLTTTTRTLLAPTPSRTAARSHPEDGPHPR